MFQINRALRSLDTTCRFVLGFFAPVVLEFALLMGALYWQCGTFYLANMLATFGFYSWYTQHYSDKRIKFVKERQILDKKSEFYQN